MAISLIAKGNPEQRDDILVSRMLGDL